MGIEENLQVSYLGEESTLKYSDYLCAYSYSTTISYFSICFHNYHQVELLAPFSMLPWISSMRAGGTNR
jgi:hypothetical protein